MPQCTARLGDHSTFVLLPRPPHQLPALCRSCRASSAQGPPASLGGGRSTADSPPHPSATRSAWQQALGTWCAAAHTVKMGTDQCLLRTARSALFVHATGRRRRSNGSNNTADNMCYFFSLKRLHLPVCHTPCRCKVTVTHTNPCTPCRWQRSGSAEPPLQSPGWPSGYEMARSTPAPISARAAGWVVRWAA
eukprot:363865-Chlamydomonas_euryale.AAC.8